MDDDAFAAYVLDNARYEIETLERIAKGLHDNTRSVEPSVHADDWSQIPHAQHDAALGWEHVYLVQRRVEVDEGAGSALGRLFDFREIGIDQKVRVFYDVPYFSR